MDTSRHSVLRSKKVQVATCGTGSRLVRRQTETSWLFEDIFVTLGWSYRNRLIQYSADLK